MYRHPPDPGVDTDCSEGAGTGTTWVSLRESTSPGSAATPETGFEELAPALPNEVAGLRRKLVAWLGKLPLDSGTVHDITLAAYEVLANAAAHAYPGGHGWTRIEGRRSGETVTVAVSDTGCGIEATRVREAGLRTSGGRGLLLVDKVTDRVAIDSGDHGTRVVMTWCPTALRRD